MAIYRFNEINDSHSSLGGKAYNLSILSQQNYPVPEGIILTTLPETEEVWKEIFLWWEGVGNPAVAVRSSASDEDDAGVSFAGQNSSYLNVTNKESIRELVGKCFESINNQ